MTRVATVALNSLMTSGINRSQMGVAEALKQQTTGKKANSYGELGGMAVRNIAAHGVVARMEAHASVAKQVGTTLALYDANMTAIDDSASSLRKSLLDAVGLNRAEGLKASIDEAFGHFRNALNANEGGQYMFAGSLVDQLPFAPSTLDDVAATPAATAFRNDTTRASGSVSEDHSVQYGLHADEIGASLYEAFRTLSTLGPVESTLTEAQRNTLQTAIGQLDKGLSDMRGVMAVNGRRQASLEDLEGRSQARIDLMKSVVGETEDADLAQVATDLMQHKTMLDVSYRTFSTISGLNLAQYLR